MNLPEYFTRDEWEEIIKEILLDELASELGTTREGLSTQAKEHDEKMLAAIQRLRDK